MEGHARRTADHVAEWMNKWQAALIVALLTALGALFMATLGGLPARVEALQDQVITQGGETRGQIMVLQVQMADVAESSKAILPLRDRVAVVEQKVERLNDAVANHEKRLDKGEQPWFGSGRK